MIYVLRVAVGFLAVCLLGAVGFQLHQNSQAPDRIRGEFREKRDRLEDKHSDDLQNLEKDYQTRFWQARGETVFDRVYNQPGQSITELIKNLAAEAFPGNWRSEVRAEEFVYFILLVQVPQGSENIASDELLARVRSILPYGAPYIKSMAFYTHNRKCFLFLDEAALTTVREQGSLTDIALSQAREKGRGFLRFNSTSLQGEIQEGHFILPVEMPDADNGILYTGLLDTGASITVITKEMASLHGARDYLNAPSRAFETANGRIYAPVVKRRIRIGPFTKTLDVAVSDKVGVCLIGMNAFEGFHYTIDSASTSVHLWPDTQSSESHIK